MKSDHQDVEERWHLNSSVFEQFAVSLAKQIVRTPMNLDEISEKLKKIGCQKIAPYKK